MIAAAILKKGLEEWKVPRGYYVEVEFHNLVMTDSQLGASEVIL